jgi:hypothetical protein
MIQEWELKQVEGLERAAAELLRLARAQAERLQARVDAGEPIEGKCYRLEGARVVEAA